jgi:hypothetical protein
MVDSKNVVSWLWRWWRGAVELEFLDGQKRARKERNTQDILIEELCRGITVKKRNKVGTVDRASIAIVFVGAVSFLCFERTRMGKVIMMNLS